MTLVELLVVTVVLGVIAGVAGLAWTPSGGATSPGSSIAAARRRAAETGVPVAVRVDSAGTMTWLALPDGRLVGSLPDSLDPLTNHD